MGDKVLFLIKFVKKDETELFNTKKYFEETISVIDFREEVLQLLDVQNPSFKIKRITYFDKEFDKYLDLKNEFFFENKLKFKIWCDVSKC